MFYCGPDAGNKRTGRVEKSKLGTNSAQCKTSYNFSCKQDVVN